MNKLFTKIAALALGATMAVGVGVAVASSGNEASPVHATAGNVTLSSGTGSGSGTTYQITWSTAHLSINQQKGSSTTNVNSSYISAPRWYQHHVITFTPLNSNQINSVTVTATSASYAQALNNSTTWTNVASHTISGSAVTITPTTKTSVFSVVMGAQSRISTIAYDYTAGGTTYTITYNANGGSGTMASTTGADPVVAACTFTAPSGKEFSYWHTTSSGTGGTTYAAGDHPKKNADLYAIWVNQKTLNSIAVTTPPTTTIYSEGQSFDPTGMVVTATFDDASTSNVTNSCTFTPSGALSTSDTSITVSYTHNGVTKTTTQVITVNEVDKFALITSDADLETGAKYVIGDSTKAHFMSSTQNTNNRGKIDLTPANDVLSYSEGLEVIELGGSAGSWTLYATKSDTKGYLYAAGASSNNYLRTKSNSTTWTITFNGNTPTLVSAAATRGTMQYNTGGMFSCYASASQVDVSLWKLVDTTESIAISKDSVSGLKTDEDTSVSITAKNFTPTDISVSYSTAGVATVTKGTISNKIIPLNVSFTGVGTTTATISVLGGKTTYTCTLDITVAAKPVSMTIVHSDIHAGVLEVITGAYKQVTFTGEDTDGNDYTIAAADVTPSATSGASYVSLSGSRITGASAGDAVVRYTLNALTSVYAEITVHVVDDYIETVGEPTFATGLEDTQGQSPTVSVFTSRPGTMHSGTATTVPFENYKFSYENSYASSEYGSVFSYDFSHGTTVDETHKLQTIYVFCDIDEVAHGSYTVTVEQLNDPLREIHFTNVVDNELSISRGGSFELEWAYTPTNPTDGKEVVFRIDENDAGIDITVSPLGLITIGASSNLGAAMVVIESAHDSNISDFVFVSATLESMTYIVRETETWSKASSISVGDEVILVNETATRELTEVNASHVGVATLYSTAPAHSFILTVGEGNAEGSFTLSNNGSYLAYTNASTSKNNNLYTLSNPTGDDQLNQVSWTIEISDGDATITNVYNTNRELQYNASSGQERFCCYVTAQTAIQIYKKSGGDTPYTVTETLFNGVHNNFGDGKTYEWSESCPSFNSTAWSSACNALTGITDYSTYKLNRAVANASGNEIEVFLAKYDNIVTKFGTTYDYLGRFAEGGINYGARIGNINPISIIGNKSDVNVIAIVVITSVVSLTAIGGYFFLRKRKENI